MSGTHRVGGEDLQVNKLYFSYAGRLPIFLNLNLTVKPGEFLSKIGPSGYGKTTLLNLLSGFYLPEQGSARLRGESIAPEDPQSVYMIGRQIDDAKVWTSAMFFTFI